MAKYLVGISESSFEDQEFLIVNDQDENDAVRLYSEWIAPSDGDFLEYVTSKSIDDSVASLFWLQKEEEEEEFMESGKIRMDFNLFRQRVREFFSGRGNEAELYLNYYFSTEELDPAEIFPAEMLGFIWRKSEFTHFTATLLEDLEEI